MQDRIDPDKLSVFPDPLNEPDLPGLSPKMLKIALRYYRTGCVKSLREGSENSITALIAGQRNNLYYQAELSVGPEGFHSVCDCPTPEQPCKHSLAALLAVRDLRNFGRFQRSSWHPIFFILSLFRRFKLT